MLDLLIYYSKFETIKHNALLLHNHPELQEIKMTGSSKVREMETEKGLKCRVHIATQERARRAPDLETWPRN